MRQSYQHPTECAGSFASWAAPIEAVGHVGTNDWVNPEYKHLVLDVPARAALAGAGQFFQIECPTVGNGRPYLRRPMSVYRADARAGQLEFLYKRTGVGTSGLAALKPGDPLRLMGPLGVGFRLDDAWRHVVMVGRGVGLATLAPLAELAASKGVGLTAILSSRNHERVMSVERFAAAGAHVEIVTDTDGSSNPHNVETILRRLHDAGRADAFYTCGSNRLMLLLQHLARELEVPGQVALEQHMACGIGMCFACVRDFRKGGVIVSRRVCWDGPVFDIAEALSW